MKLESIFLVVLLFAVSSAIPTSVGIDLSEEQIQYMINQQVGTRIETIKKLADQLAQVEAEISELLDFYDALPNDHKTMSEQQLEIFKQLPPLRSSENDLKYQIQVQQSILDSERQSFRSKILGTRDCSGMSYCNLYS